MNSELQRRSVVQVSADKRPAFPVSIPITYEREAGLVPPPDAAFFELAPLPCFIFDAEHQLVEVNPAAAQLLGQEQSRLKGQAFAPWVAPDQRELFREHLRKVLSGAESPQSVEVCLQPRGGLTQCLRFQSQRLPRPGHLGPACLSLAVDLTERRRVEEALRRNQVLLAAIYDSEPVMICLINRQREIEFMNRAMAEFLGVPLSESPTGGLPRPVPLCPELTPLHRPSRPGDLMGCVKAIESSQGCGSSAQCEQCPLRLALLETFVTGQPCRQVESSLQVRRGEGWKKIQVLASTSLVNLQGDSRLLLCLEDITRRKELELELLQAQKMEAVGQLAGGVAHDFNNILAAQMMNLAMLRPHLAADAEAESFLNELEKGTERAAGLTRQLLLFGRRQIMEHKRLNLNELIPNLLSMLRRVLGEPVEIHWQATAKPAWVEGDAGLLEQMLMNLCVNARDAMPRGGRLSLQTAACLLTAQDAGRHPDARAGAFLCLSVNDTGSGMDAATLKRIFEPFFTTKEQGKGTGLGLATVYGIVRQHQGWVEVQSAPGQGSSFHIFLPQAQPAAVDPPPALPVQPTGGKGETLLLVEDDDTLRGIIALNLEARGYRVLEAASGQEALQQWEEHSDKIELVFSDMVMPGRLSGLELVEKLRALRPGLPAILSSGYSPDLIHADRRGVREIAFLPKPYQAEELAQLLRACLEKTS